MPVLSAVDGGAVQPGQQRAGGAGAEAVRRALPDQDTAWLVIAMASTLAGNFTVLGSIANLIVVQKAAAARRRDRLLGLFPRRRAADRASRLSIGTLWLWR